MVLDVIRRHIDKGTDTTVGGYNSFCFLTEQGNGNEVVRAATAVLEELTAHAGNVYKTPNKDLHFHTHIHAYPALPESGGVQYNAEQVKRFLEISEELISATPCFDVEFRGVACTKDGVLLCGYAERALDELRNRYYAAIEKYPDAFILPLGQTIDHIKEKYGEGIAAVIGARLLGALQNPCEYVATAERHADTNMGRITVTHLTFTAQNGWIDVQNKNNDRVEYSQRRIDLKA